jgi:hypothetical protein
MLEGWESNTLAVRAEARELHGAALNRLGAPRIMHALALGLMFCTFGCAAHRGIEGRWAVDPDASLLPFKPTTQPVQRTEVPSAAPDRARDAAAAQPSFEVPGLMRSSSALERRMRGQLASLQYIFHGGREGNPFGKAFDGLLEIRSAGQVIGFGGWKRLSGKGDRGSYQVFEAVSESMLLPQGVFHQAANSASWDPQWGDFGGMKLVLKRK